MTGEEDKYIVFKRVALAPGANCNILAGGKAIFPKKVPSSTSTQHALAFGREHIFSTLGT